MRFPKRHQSVASVSRVSGFTLAEVLAALAFMAIVVPVSIEGIRLANVAGQLSQRKTVAVRVAERVLAEWGATSPNLGAAQRGTCQEGALDYHWAVSSTTWSEDTMRLVTVRVTFAVQGMDHDIQLSTLIDSTITL